MTMSARIITFANKKGGSGKTTTAVNVCASLAQKGKKCLLVDMDPQCHATLISGINPYESSKGIGSLFKGANITDVIKNTPFGLYSIIPSYHKDEPVILYSEITPPPLKKKVFITELKALFDFIIFDTPPGRDDIFSFCLSVSDELMIPMPLQFLAMEGLAQLTGFLYKITETVNPDITLSAIIPVMIDMRTRHANDVYKELVETFGSQIIKRGIRLDIKLAEAAWAQKPICLYAPMSKAAYDFHLLAEEIIA